jgi:hypothetical protein
LQRQSGRIDIGGRKGATDGESQRPPAGETPVDYVFAFPNGLKVTVDDRAGDVSGTFPQWRLLQRGKGDIFLHKYYRRGEATDPITTVISVVE